MLKIHCTYCDKPLVEVPANVPIRFIKMYAGIYGYVSEIILNELYLFCDSKCKKGRAVELIAQLKLALEELNKELGSHPN